jgi:hypothetical protein
MTDKPATILKEVVIFDVQVLHFPGQNKQKRDAMQKGSVAGWIRSEHISNANLERRL